MSPKSATQILPTCWPCSEGGQGRRSRWTALVAYLCLLNLEADKLWISESLTMLYQPSCMETKLFQRPQALNRCRQIGKDSDSVSVWANSIQFPSSYSCTKILQKGLSPSGTLNFPGHWVPSWQLSMEHKQTTRKDVCVLGPRTCLRSLTVQFWNMNHESRCGPGNMFDHHG